MASSKEYRDFILDQLESLKEVTCKPMMGEYLLYYRGVLIGGIYDDRFLVKKTKSNIKYNLEDVVPYPNAKSMFYIKDVDNIEHMNIIIMNVYKDLK